MTDTTQGQAASTPTTLPVVKHQTPDAAWHADFNFFRGRWTTDEGLKQAKSVVKFLIRQGYDACLHMGLDDSWLKGTKTVTPYYRVYIRHPNTAGYYTWFAPASEKTWTDPLDFSLATWFEFVEPKS